jgi:hypothetical protein
MMLLLLLACPPTKTDDTSTTDTTPFSCDTLSCAETDLCVRQDYPAECTNREDTGAACPEGTTATMCGGAGIPCCCEPAPVSTFTCQACGDTPSCECVTCESGTDCMEQASTSGREFVCEELAMP